MSPHLEYQLRKRIKKKNADWIEIKLRDEKVLLKNKIE